jgi:hypothetical protein
MKLTSASFGRGETIPERFTCDGDNISPDITWSDVPEDTVEVALTCLDPDAPSGLFVHWTIWGLDPSRGGIGEDEVPTPARQGRNGFGDVGYGGPCPPRGDPHRYVFHAYALSDPLDVSGGATVEELERAMADIVLDDAELVGTYRR